MNTHPPKKNINKEKKYTDYMKRTQIESYIFSNKKVCNFNLDNKFHIRYYGK
jgi:hypothetical protein